MSIIVKGAELPENCRSCWFGLNLRDGEQDLCQLLERSCAVCDTRPDDCPLAEQTECKSDTDTISRTQAIIAGSYLLEGKDTNVPSIDTISRQEAIDEIEERKNANGYRNVAVISELNRFEGYIMQLPSAQPEITEAIVKEYCEKHCLAVVDARLFKEMKRRWSSAQPQLPEWAQKVEEYRKSALSHIHNPLAWALYQTWKEYDG